MKRIRWSAVVAVGLAFTFAGGSGAARDPDKVPRGQARKQVPGEAIVKFGPGVRTASSRPSGTTSG